MPVVELNFLRLQKLLGNHHHHTISKKTIIDTLPFLGLDVESESANEMRIEYSPNRPDYSTDYGIALGLEGLLGIRKGNINLKIRKSNYRINVDPAVSRVRPYVTGICAKAGDGIIDQNMIKQLMAMQEDLHFGIGRKRKKSSIGIHDLDAISFPLRYKTSPRSHTMIPLNETRVMTIREILENTQTGQRYGHLLGGVTTQKRVPIILDSKGKTVSFPPIINSSLTAVTMKTKNLFVEVTGLNPDDVEDALSVVATILQKAGFALYTVKISGAKNSTAKLAERKMTLDPKLVSDTLGLDMSVGSIISCLKKSRIGAIPLKNKRIQCVIPRYRFDIFGPMDLVEEVILGYGVAKLSPRLSPPQTFGNAGCDGDNDNNNNHVKNLRVIDDMMVGLGYTEALNSSLTSKRVLCEAANRNPTNVISVLDSKSGEHTVLRDLILPGLVENLAGNIHRSYPQKLYETGTVFSTGNPITEQTHVAAVLAYPDGNFSELKSVLQSVLCTGFNIDMATKNTSNPLFEEGRTANVLVKGRVAGMIGNISSKTLDYFKIRVPVVGFEIKLIGLIFDQ